MIGNMKSEISVTVPRAPTATLKDIDGMTVEFPRGLRDGAVHGDFLLPRPLVTVVSAQVTTFVYEWERYLEGKVQILGVSVEPPEEGKKFLERVTRDCQEDRPHIPLDPYPLRLLCDPDATLIRAVGTENEDHWAGLIAALVTYVVNSRAIRHRWRIEITGPL
jgi:AhpC/TSA family